MKKIYSKPALMVVELGTQAQTPLCGSQLGIDPNPVNPGGSDARYRGRDFDDWDDEDLF